MSKSKNKEVQSFLDDINLLDIEKYKIIQKIRRNIFKIFPDIHEDIKYGGIVFLSDGYLFSGIFVRKKHVSLEFVQGVEMNDPEKLLEGTGKFRRHLKLMSLADLKDKSVDFFLKQSL
jgi:hypothetical protein